MAGFFYLGGSSSEREEQSRKQQGLFLYKNEEIYNNNSKGFEIWPEYHQHQHQGVNNSYITAFGVGPSRINLSFSDELSSRSAGFTAMGSQVGGGMNCQDCGNQAKKDCVHLRCRTCCKSRGFECPTHVKSTWVPAAKRRERQQQQQLEALQKQQQLQKSQLQQDHQQTQFRVEDTKRHRNDGDDHQGLDMVKFPGEVNSQALFRCVRVSRIDDAEEAYAYQTSVNIGGHVFKGILYDHGPDGTGGADISPGGDGGGPNTQQLDLIMANETNNTCTTNSTNAAAAPTALLDPSSMYPAPLNAFMAGTQFFTCSRP